MNLDEEEKMEWYLLFALVFHPWGQLEGVLCALLQIFGLLGLQ